MHGSSESGPPLSEDILAWAPLKGKARTLKPLRKRTIMFFIDNAIHVLSNESLSQLTLRKAIGMFFR